MTALKIEDIRQFTKKLFLEEAFDEFCLIEGKVVTYNQFMIDGHLTEDYYTPEELEAMGNPKLSTWKQIRPFCFSLIKGSRTPKSFQFLFQLSNQQVEQLLRAEGLNTPTESLQGLLVNLKYENGSLTAMTSVLFKEFSMDKTIDSLWGAKIKAFLKSHDISTEEI